MRVTYQEVYEGVVAESGKTGFMISVISLAIYLFSNIRDSK